MNIDIDKLRSETARLKQQNYERDMERGYCELPFPAVSDEWAMECYERHWAVVKPLLTDYAALVLANGEFIPLGKDDELLAIISELEVARRAKHTSLGGTCLFISQVFLPPLIRGKSRLTTEKYAEMVLKVVEDYPLSIYDRYEGDYEGNYDAYYARKREELDKWLNAR